eukprot:5626660-Prymnesium_polylepis.1
MVGRGARRGQRHHERAPRVATLGGEAVDAHRKLGAAQIDRSEATARRFTRRWVGVPRRRVRYLAKGDASPAVPVPLDQRPATARLRRREGVIICLDDEQPRAEAQLGEARAGVAVLVPLHRVDRAALRDERKVGAAAGGQREKLCRARREHVETEEPHRRLALAAVVEHVFAVVELAARRLERTSPLAALEAQLHADVARARRQERARRKARAVPLLAHERRHFEFAGDDAARLGPDGVGRPGERAAAQQRQQVQHRDLRRQLGRRAEGHDAARAHVGRDRRAHELARLHSERRLARGDVVAQRH